MPHYVTIEDPDTGGAVITKEHAIQALVIPQAWDVAPAQYMSKRYREFLADKWEPCGIFNNKREEVIVLFKKRTEEIDEH